ncbi:MAG: DedA family protein [Clostridiaceae bacterium]|nr:DedA family protein [Clostridiaceae bacterium]
MTLIKQFIDLFMHLDIHLSNIIQDFGIWTNVILFAVIFCETGLVIIPFLPGDSLIFAAGAFAAKGDLNIFVLYFGLCIAAIIGNIVNYQIGRFVGPKVFDMEKIWFLKKEYLVKTQKFYEKHGAITIILTRFMPIIRTFAPFIAGVSQMNYKKFLTYNIVGGITWVSLFLFLGYEFGNFKIVKENFSLVIYGILFISVLPAVIGFVKQKYFTKVAEIK